MALRLVMASDHGGFSLKEDLKKSLASADILITDLGVHRESSVDYPDLAHALCDVILENGADIGLLVCGTGIGMSMAANRHPGIRAALCTDPYMSRMARNHNDANVLCLGGRVIGPSLAEDIAREFINEDYDGGRHARRIGKIDFR